MFAKITLPDYHVKVKLSPAHHCWGSHGCGVRRGAFVALHVGDHRIIYPCRMHPSFCVRRDLEAECSSSYLETKSIAYVFLVLKVQLSVKLVIAMVEPRNDSEGVMTHTAESSQN